LQREAKERAFQLVQCESNPVAPYPLNTGVQDFDGVK